MAEDIAATPGWVEDRLDEIWASAGIAETPRTASARSTYLGCLATCGAEADDPGQCQDLCRQAFMEALRSAGTPHASTDSIRWATLATTSSCGLRST